MQEHVQILFLAEVWKKLLQKHEFDWLHVETDFEF